MNYDSDQDFDKEPGGMDDWDDYDNAYEERRRIERQRKEKELKELKVKLEKIKEGRKLEIEIIESSIKGIDKRIAFIDEKLNSENIEFFEINRRWRIE